MANLLLVTFTGNLLAQSEDLPTIPITIVDVNIDSNIISSTGSGTDAVVIFTHDLSLPGVPWLRLHFKEVKLSASDDGTKQSFLRLTSMEDGDQQILDMHSLVWWGNSSAYFNGDEVKVELLAYANTGDNRIVLDKVLTADFGGDPVCDPITIGICGPDDDRVSSYEPGVGRLRFQKRVDCISEEALCTAFLINNQHCGFLTAGHCCSQMVSNCPLFKSVVEFNVPPSDPDGSINVSAYSDQFPIDTASRQIANPTPNDGEDWCYFGTYPRSGSTPKDSEGSTYTLASTVPPADGSTLRLTGYGQDTDPPGTTGECNEDNHTQQTATGPYTNLNGTIVRFQVDAQPVNSGSPVKHESSGEVYAILTDGLCNNADNLGTAVDHPDLLNALANPRGMCDDCNNNGIQDCKDLATGNSQDCDGDGLLDDCQRSCCVGTVCYDDLSQSYCESFGGNFFTSPCCPRSCSQY